MGGIIILQAGKGDVEYIFTEKDFGQFAPNEEVAIGSLSCDDCSDPSSKQHAQSPVLGIVTADSVCTATPQNPTMVLKARHWHVCSFVH